MSTSTLLPSLTLLRVIAVSFTLMLMVACKQREGGLEGAPTVL
jgi:hypothetical protein